MLCPTLFFYFWGMPQQHIQAQHLSVCGPACSADCVASVCCYKKPVQQCLLKAGVESCTVPNVSPLAPGVKNARKKLKRPQNTVLD